MPSTGIPSSSSAGSSLGASGAYTDAGPPDRIRPRGLRRATSAAPTWCRRSSEKTPHSRTRRAISCEYWPPKSSTNTSSVATGRVAGAEDEVVAASLIQLVDRRCDLGLAVRPHADVLLALELLALALQRRRDHHLGAMKRR